MNDKGKDGGPAFPVHDIPGRNTVAPEHFAAQCNDAVCTGMMMRDYFAAKAMQAIIAKLPLRAAGKDNAFGLDNDWMIEHEVNERVAAGAYRYADAMLDARKAGAQ